MLKDLTEAHVAVITATISLSPVRPGAVLPQIEEIEALLVYCG